MNDAGTGPSDDVIRLSFLFDTTLDSLAHADALVLGIFEDERPLRGTTGFVDWRLHGFFSKLVVRKRFRGTLLESCLTPGRSRVPTEKVLLLGLGPSPELSLERFGQIAEEVVTTMSRLQVQHLALSMWDLTRGRVAPDEAATLFFRQMLADAKSRRGQPVTTAMTFLERGPWGRALRDGFRQLSERSRELPIRLEIR